MTLRDAVEILFRRKLVMLTFFLAALGGGYVGLRALTPSYQASVQLLVKLGQEDVYMPLLPTGSSGTRSPLATANLAEQANSEVQILRSPALARQILAKYGPDALFPGIDLQHPWYTLRGLVQTAARLYREVGDFFYPASADPSAEERAFRRLQGNIQAAQVKDSTVVEVSVRSSVPAVAAAVANDLVAFYLEQRSALYSGEDDAFLTLQVGTLATQISAAEAALQGFRQKHDVLDSAQQRTAALGRLSEVRASLQNETIASSQAQQRIGLLQAQLNDQTQLRQITANPLYVRLQDDLFRAQSDAAPHRGAIRDLTRLAAELTAQVDQLNQNAGEEERMQHQVQVLQDSRKLYLAKIEEARLHRAMALAHHGNVSVISWAATDRTLVSPRLNLVLGGVLAAGLLGGIGLAVLLHLLDDRIKSEAEVLRSTGLPVIARIGNLRGRALT